MFRTRPGFDGVVISTKPLHHRCGRPTTFPIAAILLVSPAFGQESSSVEELQRVIEAQQVQIEKQQEQLENLQETLDDQTRVLQELQSQVESISVDSDQEAAAVASSEPADRPPELADASPPAAARISERDRHDLDSPTAANVTYFGPSRTAMRPGAGTEVGVHGLVQFQMFHDTVGLNNNRFDTATIPPGGGPSQTKFSVNPTQLAVSTITGVERGQLNTWLSLDMNGQLDRPEPRLRIAFGEYVDDVGGWALLGGQTYSTMLDMRAVPETLDFALPAGLWAQRQPLLRYTRALGSSWTTEFSAETPENVRYTDAEKRTKWPDFSAAATWFADGDHVSHLRFAALVRDLRAEGPDGSTDSATGWAISGSTKIWLSFLGERDNLKITVHHGEGYGTQLKGGPTEGIYDPVNSSLETIGLTSTFGGIQHFWSDHFRSNLAFGHIEADNPALVARDTLKSTSYIAADLIWNPFTTTTLGIEYLWGRRENESGETGDSNRLLFSSMFRF